MEQNSPMDYWIRCLHIPTGWYLGKWKYKKTEDGAYLTTQRCCRTRLQMVAFWMGQVNILEHPITLARQLFFLVSTTFSNHFEVLWVVDIKMGTLGHIVFFFCFKRKESSHSAHAETTPFWHWSLQPSRTVLPGQDCLTMGPKLVNAETKWVLTQILLFCVHCLSKGCVVVSLHSSKRTSVTD